MMYLLLSIALLCTANLSAYDNMLVPTNATTIDNQDLDTTPSPAATTKVIVPLEKELSLQKVASIYKKLLHDKDAIKGENFVDQYGNKDENLRSEVEKVIQDRINTVKNILDTEAPELAAKVEEEYAAPKRKLIIIGTVAILVVGASILALFSYDSTTNTWGKPTLTNAKTSLTKVINKCAHAFDEEPEAVPVVAAAIPVVA